MTPENEIIEKIYFITLSVSAIKNECLLCLGQYDRK